jgi:protein-tyrosine phosphatase
MRVPIADCSSIILKDYFPTVFEFINSTLESGGRILVHCFAGKSRSASFVIAYLMQRHRMNYMDAFKHVQYHRSVVEPNLGFELQLHAFEKSIHSNT